MLIGTEKYACEACIRGHRVSSCHHNDRELKLVAPKGRPVSQCPHCRGLRKTRAQHVKCDCAEKGHSEAECPHKKIDKPEPRLCCCSHGTRCGCSLKKDHHKDHHLDTVPEDVMSDMATPESFDIRPRSSISTPSEGKSTVCSNGHHKPPHKHNDAAHTRGLPYTIPRSHSIHGHSEIAQRSVDSLPHTKRSLISQETPQHHDSVTSAPQPVRRVKSEHGSPDLSPSDSNLAPISTTFPQLDSTYSPFGLLSGNNSPANCGVPMTMPEQFPESYFGYPTSSTEFETPLHSAGINAPSVDWSSFNLPYDPNGEYVAAPSQPPSYASFDYSHCHPGLTSSSGELSEAEDYSNVSEPATTNATNGYTTQEIKFEPDNYDTDQYRLSSASSMMAAPHQANAMNMLKQDSIASMDIDEFLRQAEERTREMEAQNRRQHTGSISSGRTSVSTPPTQMPQQTPLHGLTVREAQNYAHMNGSESESGDNGIRKRDQCIRQLSNNSGEDPMWSNPEINSPEEIKWDS